MKTDTFVRKDNKIVDQFKSNTKNNTWSKKYAVKRHRHAATVSNKNR